MRREALAAWRKQVGDADPQTPYALRRLGFVLEDEGKWQEAETVWRESLDEWRKREGIEGQQSMYTLRKLGLALEAERKWEEAEAIWREALAISRKQGGNEGPEALKDLEGLVRVLKAEKKFSEAQQILDDVLAPAFVTQQPSGNLVVLRADIMGRRGKWQEAATNAALLLQLQPDEQYNYHRLAGLLAMNRGLPAYEQLCQKEATKFSDTANPYIAERVAQDCLLLPHSGVDSGLVDKLADIAVTRGSGESALPFFQACKAMSDYRLGHFAEAIEWGEKAVKSSTADAQAKAKAYAILAMANWRLGQKDAAQAMLAEGEKLAPGIKPGPDALDLGESWVAWLFARISLDEATALIQSGPTTDSNSNSNGHSERET